MKATPSATLDPQQRPLTGNRTKSNFLSGVIAGITLGLFVAVGIGPAVAGRAEPDGYRIATESRFQPLTPDDQDRPAWLFGTARGVAQSADGAREWIIYELVLDRGIPFHHLLVELLLDGEISGLFVRLLDDRRHTLSADLMGNIAERLDGQGNVFLDLPLADKPEAAVVHLLIPASEEPALRQISVIPASYEILMKTSGDFVSGARAWIRTPVYDPKNLALLADLVMLEDGRVGDMSSPISSFAAYGVDARPLDEFDFLPDAGDGYHYAGTAFALDAIPALARFNVTVRHFDPLKPIEVWLNKRHVGVLSLHVPDLEDAAYWPEQQPGAWRIGRWTRGWFFIDHDDLRMGDNVLVVSQRSGDPNAPPLEMYGPALQFKYPWDEIATYPLLHIRDGDHPDRVVAGIDVAPPDTAHQEEDVFILRADRAFRPVGPATDKPNWLTSVDLEETETLRRYVIRLNPEQLPHQLGLDVIYMRGRQANVRVSLLNGDTVVADNVFGTLKLDSPYVQSTLPMQIPLRSYGADTVVMDIDLSGTRPPTLSRLQLKAAWPSAVLAKGHFEAEGSLANLHYDFRSAHVPGEAIVPGPEDDTRTSGGGTSEWVQRIPLQETGTWYGVETRILQREPVPLGDSRNLYFLKWNVQIDEAPLLGRIDLLVQHLNVVEGLEVRVNGEVAGRVSLHLPGLQDANYMLFRVNRIADDGQSLTPGQRYAIDYGPYARASLVFDGRLLRPGNNVIAVGKAPRLKGTNDHYAMKEVRLQLKYPWAKDVPAH